MASAGSARPTVAENVQGIAWAILATGMFSATAAMAKFAVTEYHVLQILFFRQLVLLISTVPSVARGFPEVLKTRHPFLHGARLLGSFIALSASIWAVAVLPLTTAVALGFAQVFFVALLAIWLLRESVGPHRIAAVVTGFLGVLIVMRPGADGLINLYALIPLLGASGAALAIISVRRLSQTDSAATLLFYQALFIGLLAGIPLFWLWTAPDLNGLLFLLAMGLVATLAQWAGVKALKLGEASVVSNIQYSQLIYAAIFGFVFFDELPDGYTIIGACVIIMSALYIVYRETLRKRTA